MVTNKTKANAPNDLTFMLARISVGRDILDGGAIVSLKDDMLGLPERRLDI